MSKGSSSMSLCTTIRVKHSEDWPFHDVMDFMRFLTKELHVASSFKNGEMLVSSCQVLFLFNSFKTKKLFKFYFLVILPF